MDVVSRANKTKRLAVVKKKEREMYPYIYNVTNKRSKVRNKTGYAGKTDAFAVVGSRVTTTFGIQLLMRMCLAFSGRFHGKTRQSIRGLSGGGLHLGFPCVSGWKYEGVTP